MEKNLKIKQKCKNIKLLLTDVDGVLTDGGRYYSKEGEMLNPENTGKLDGLLYDMEGLDKLPDGKKPNLKYPMNLMKNLKI